MSTQEQYQTILSSLPTTLNKSLDELKSATNLNDLEQLKAKYIGKNGEISAIMQYLKIVPIDQKKEFGAKVNLIKAKFEEALLNQKEALLSKELNQKLAFESIDVTLNGRGNHVGTFHPISLSLKILSIK